MTYTACLEWLFQQLPMYQNSGASAYKADLSKSLALDAYLSKPHQHFKSIHIAGTNGKGSVSHMMASVLQSQGYKVGLYTSPHLKDFRERIKVNGRMISEDDVLRFVTQHQSYFETHQLSFFEMTVGMAFDYFKIQAVDFAVIEVGLGGRLDSTNIIKPILSVITNIGLDHTKFLGETHTAIASEKAGIIKPNTPVVIGETTTEITPVFKAKAEKEKAPIYFAEQLNLPEVTSDLKGSYQQKNLNTVASALRVLRQDLAVLISEDAIKNGLNSVVAQTGLLGRWQILSKQPLIIADTAHNKEGLTYTMQQLSELKFKDCHLVIGVVNDKDLKSILPLFPKYAKYYFVNAAISRALPAEQLRETAVSFGLLGDVYSSVNEGLNAAKKNANIDDLIYVGGSTFTVAEIL